MAGLFTEAIRVADEASRNNGGDGNRTVALIDAIRAIGNDDQEEAIRALATRAPQLPPPQEDLGFSFLGGRRQNTEEEQITATQRSSASHEPTIGSALWAAAEATIVNKIGRKNEEPGINRLGNKALEIVSSGIQAVEKRFGVDLKVDNFSIASAPGIAEQIIEAIQAQRAVVPPELDFINPAQLESQIQTIAAHMMAASFGKKLAGEGDLSIEEEALAHNLKFLPPHMWLDKLKDEIMMLTADNASEAALGGRLVRYRDDLQRNNRKLKEGGWLPKNWFVQNPYALRSLTSEERKQVATTLWGLSTTNLSILPIVKSALASDWQPWNYSQLYGGGEYAPNATDVYLRPGTPTVIDIIREKVPFLSPALAGSDLFPLQAGTIVLEDASTGKVKGVISTQEPEKVIQMLGEAARTSRGVAELVRLASSATLGTETHAWRYKIPRALRVIETVRSGRLLSTNAKNSLGAQIDNESRMMTGNLHYLENQDDPDRARQMREDELIAQSEHREERLKDLEGDLFNEAESKGYIQYDIENRKWRKTNEIPAGFEDRVWKVSRAKQQAEAEGKLVRTIQKAREKGILDGSGTNIGAVSDVSHPLTHEAFSLRRIAYPNLRKYGY